MVKNHHQTPILSAFVAMDENRVIGHQNQLPWHMPADLRHFKSITTGHIVLMGRKTYEAIGKPLPNRTNIVMTRKAHYEAPGCTVVKSVVQALDLAEAQSQAQSKSQNNQERPEVFVIGGAEIYHLLLPYFDKIYLTIIHHRFDGDTFFPPINAQDWHETKRVDCTADRENPYNYSFIWLERKVS